MRKTWGRLLRNLDAFDGDPNTTMITDLAEHEGVDVGRIMDALETLKILGIYNIDVTEATGRTTIFIEDDGPYAGIAASLGKAMNSDLPPEFRDVPRFDGGIEVGGTTHVKPTLPKPEWSADQHDADKFDLIFIDGPAMRAKLRETNAERADLESHLDSETARSDVFVPVSFEPTVRHRICRRCNSETVCGLDLYGWKTALAPYNDWRVAWIDPEMSVLPECEGCK